MRKRLLILALGALLLPFFAAAQTPTELETAKALAKSYGYSESEIESILNDPSKARTEKPILETETVKDADSPLLVRQAEPGEEEEEDVREIYGHSFFSSKAFSIIPSINTPAPASFVLGPGDDIVIDVWGSATAKINTVIGRDGTILINGVGPVQLGGLTVKRAESTLKSKLSKIYGDIGNGTQIKLTLNRIRSITVNVVGDVVVPGAYALPALAQVTSAIFMAGGVEETASVRNIRIFRGGRIAGTFDLYDFIFNGTLDENLRLQDGDIISVPSYHSVVDVAGFAKRPMAYEALEGETVADMITYAGGFADDAFTDWVYLERKGSFKGTAYQVRSGDLDSFHVVHGDLVNINSRTVEFANRACVFGAVRQPGLYPINDQITDVRSLIEAAGGLAEEAYKERATLFRKDANMQPVSVSVNLEEVLGGRTRIVLAREDSLHVYTATELRSQSYVRVYGAVNGKVIDGFRLNDTETELEYRPGMSVYDAILEAGGFADGADRANIEVASKGGKEKGSVRRLDLEADPESGALPLQPEDAIFVRSLLHYREPQTISINGEVNYPGTYVIGKNVVRLSDIVQRAGMFTSDAYVKGAQLERTITKVEKARMEVAIELAGQQIKSPNKLSTLDSLKNQVKDIYTIGIDLEQAMKNPGSDADVILRTGDVITVPVMNNTVKISGAVFYPNTVVYNPKFTWRDYINQAGGRRHNTKANKIYAVYMNGLVAKKGSANFKMEPGMELVVTSEPKEERKMTTAEIVTVASSSTSIAYMVMALVRMFF